MTGAQCCFLSECFILHIKLKLYCAHLVSVVVSSKEVIGGKVEVKQKGLNSQIIREQCEHIIQY